MEQMAGGVRIEGGTLEELYVRHAPDAIRLAFLLTGSGTLAEASCRRPSCG
jgi:hypothetical protein